MSRKGNETMETKRIAGRLWVMAAAAVLVTGAAGCGSKKADHVAAIQEAGVFQVAIVDTDSSYTHLENGAPSGLEPELTEYIAQALGVKASYQVCTRQEALEAVASKQADIALGCINTSGSLTDDYLLSTPYGKGFFYAVTRRGDFALTVGSLENSVVGAENGLDEATRTQLFEAEGIKVVDCSGVEQAAKDLKEGEIRVYICYEQQARQLLEDPGLQVQNISNLDPEEYVILAGKTDQALVGGINTLIQQFLEKE